MKIIFFLPIIIEVMKVWGVNKLMIFGRFIKISFFSNIKVLAKYVHGENSYRNEFQYKFSKNVIYFQLTIYIIC